MTTPFNRFHESEPTPPRIVIYEKGIGIWQCPKAPEVLYNEKYLSGRDIPMPDFVVEHLKRARAASAAKKAAK